MASHRNSARAMSIAGLTIIAATCLAACGGGGGSSGGGTVSVNPTPTATPAPSPSPTVAPQSLTGKVVEFTSGSALAGFTVTVGTLPNAATCNAAQTQSLNVCGAPAAIAATATTAADGTFSVPAIGAGTYMLTIDKDSTYATLHRQVTIATGQTNALGTVKVAALSSDEQAWLVDFNNQRATVSVPVSFGNLQVDEYAEEQARQWTTDVVAGKTIFSDAGYAPYQSAYSAEPGALYAASGVLTLSYVFGEYSLADRSWMSEKANCPNGNWQTCVFAENTGHYINISNTVNVWIGLGGSSMSFNYPPLGNQWADDVMIIENANGGSPASFHRGNH